MTNNELELEGFQLCVGGGDCDQCLCDIPEGEYFWERTSYEYVEGNYWCRPCAIAEIERTRKLYGIIFPSVQP